MRSFAFCAWSTSVTACRGDVFGYTLGVPAANAGTSTPACFAAASARSVAAAVVATTIAAPALSASLLLLRSPVLAKDIRLDIPVLDSPPKAWPKDLLIMFMVSL